MLKSCDAPSGIITQGLESVHYIRLAKTRISFPDTSLLVGQCCLNYCNFDSPAPPTSRIPINSTEVVSFHLIYLANMFRCGIVALLVLAGVASAHMSVTPAEITPGGRATFALTISHDCGTDTIGTSNFTVAVPKGFVSVTVEDTPGWHTIIHKYMHDTVTIGTSTYNESVSSVEFHGFLPDGYYKSFGIKARAPMADVGTKFWWSGYQDCHAKGTPIAWMEIPSEEDPSPRRPARATVIVAPEEEGGH